MSAPLIFIYSEPMEKAMMKHMAFLDELMAGTDLKKKAEDDGVAAELELGRLDREIEKLVKERREAEGRRDDAKRRRDEAEETIEKAGKETEEMKKIMIHYSRLTRTHVDRAEKKKKKTGR